MNKKYDYMVYIGRFQPLTLAHEEMIKKALELSEMVIIIIGSHNASPSMRNPFTTKERKEMIKNAFSYNDYKRIIFLEIEDSAYNFSAWITEIQRKVSNVYSGGTVALLGHEKDDTSFYLRHFPSWELETVDSLMDGLSATDVRNIMFDPTSAKVYRNSISVPVYRTLTSWIEDNPYRYKSLTSEFQHIQSYKNQWKDSPYPPTFVTTDAMVICNGHLLLIKRGNNPGKDLFALPGGFLEQHENAEDGCFRELVEETKIHVDKSEFKKSIKDVKFFDSPWRDPRGRMITFAHYVEIERMSNLPWVEAADDANEVHWIPLGSLDMIKSEFFIDHYQIIKYFLNRR